MRPFSCTPVLRTWIKESLVWVRVVMLSHGALWWCHMTGLVPKMWKISSHSEQLQAPRNIAEFPWFVFISAIAKFTKKSRDCLSISLVEESSTSTPRIAYFLATSISWCSVAVWDASRCIHVHNTNVMRIPDHLRYWSLSAIHLWDDHLERRQRHLRGFPRPPHVIVHNNAMTQQIFD